MNPLKSLLQTWLENRAAAYLRKHQPILVVVTGSVGKTSTKTAIATVLGEKYRVRMHEGNHNTHMSVPLAIMGVNYPSQLKSPLAWWEVARAIRLRMAGPKDVDVVVQELGADQPGDITRFMRYLHPSIAVVTAVSAEHMANFKTLEAVAREELAVAAASDRTIVNRDDIDSAYAPLADTHVIDTYGLSPEAEYRVELENPSPLDGKSGRFICPEWGVVPINLQLIGAHSVKAAAAAGAVAAKLGLSSSQVAVGMARIQPVAGRMQLLRGLNGSTIIDDTYNASPLAVRAALETLYSIDTLHRIAILGSMNELGDSSPAEHTAIGKLCDPVRLEYVVTIGDDAAKYLAPAALANGCQVKTFMSPYQAGGFVHSVLRPDTVVLAKGSQNGVFAEEAVKVLLAATADEARLVRQSPDWLRTKSEQFSADI